MGWLNNGGGAGGGSGDMAKATYDPQSKAADAFARANHTGTQLASTISDFSTAADARVAAAAGVSVASLSGGKVPSSQLPAIAITSIYTVASQAAQLALTAQEGDVAVRTDQNLTYIQNGGSAGTMADWTQLLSPTDVVTSVNGQVGVVVVSKSDVGLGNVTNDAQLKIASNLSDLANAATARDNLGVRLEYQAVVAASGGDYTTVGAAITAGKTSIYVRNGTYSESSFSPAAGTTIVGESRDGVILDFGGTGFITADSNLFISNLTIKNWQTTGGIRAVTAATDCQFTKIRFECVTGSTTNAIRLGGFRRVLINGCLFNNGLASVTTQFMADASDYFTGLITHNVFQGYYLRALNVTQGSIFRFAHNYCQATYDSTTAGAIVDVNFTGTLHDCSIENNYLATDSAATAQRGVRLQNCQYLSVRDNNISVRVANGVAIELIAADETLITGNYVIQGNIAISIDASSDNTRVGVNHSQASTYISDSGVGTKIVSLLGDTITEGELALTDVTTANVSTSAHGLTPKAPNDTTKYLRGDGTWATPAGGGQTVVNKVVAPSGGDYTTLGAAIAAASAGWVIWVYPGSYTESAITSALNNITIVGMDPESTALDFSSNTITLSGTNVTVRGVKMTFTTGKLAMSGADATLRECTIANGGNGAGLSMSGIRYACQANRLTVSVGNATDYHWIFSGANGRVDGNYIELQLNSGFEGLNINANSVFSANTVLWKSGGGTNGALVNVTSDQANITGNVFVGGNGAGAAIKCTAAYLKVTGNTITEFTFGVRLMSAPNYNVVTGNSILNSLNSSAYGVRVEAAGYYNVVTGNVISQSGAGTSYGVDVAAGSDNTVSGNTITATTCVRSATTNTNVSSNTLSPNTNSGGVGIGVDVTSNGHQTSIVGNRVDYGTYGIQVASNNNTIVGNNCNGATNRFNITSTTTGNTILDNEGQTAANQKRVLLYKNTSGGTIGAGAVVVQKSVAAGDEITTTTSAGDSAVVGVTEAAISNNAYGPVVVEGKTTILKADGTTDIAIGDWLSTFTTTEIAKKASPTEMVFAKALEAYTTDDSAGVLDALIIKPFKL